MQIELAVLRDAGIDGIPGDGQFDTWVEATLESASDNSGESVSLVIRITGEAESRRLNREYRGQDRATNVLSFPSDLPAGLLDELTVRPLGDLAICAPIIYTEASQQDKPDDHHWAHMTVHGLLHLLGHDHEEPESASLMESLERSILGQFGIPDPYSC